MSEAVSGENDKKEVHLGSDDLLRVLTFSSGGFDGMMYLGTVHSLLLAGYQPDIIAGISAGAVAATMAAEVLQAGDGLAGDQKAAQVTRFREFLEIAQQLPDEIARDLFPHLLELGSPAPLEPLRSPLLPEKERDERELAVKARHGLLLLYNGLLSSRLRVSTLTRIVRRYLDIPAINAWQPRWIWRRLDGSSAGSNDYSAVKHRLGLGLEHVARQVWMLGYLFQLWIQLFLPIITDAGLVCRGLWAIAVGWRVQQNARIPSDGPAAPWYRDVSSWFRWLFPRSRSPRSVKRIIIPHMIPISWVLGGGSVLAKSLTYVAALALWIVLLPVFASLWIMGIVSLVASSFAPLMRRSWRRLIGKHRWLQRSLSWLVRRGNAVRGNVRVMSVIASIAVLAAVVLDSLLLFPPVLGLLWAHPRNVLLAIALVLVATSLTMLTRGAWNDPTGSFLAYFDLKADLATSYMARLLFVRAFDKDFYGTMDLGKIIASALEGGHAVAPDGESKPRSLGQYLKRSRPIMVLPVAANVGSGKIDAADPCEYVVDALCAATALVPIFRASPLRFGREPLWQTYSWYIDGINVAPEPHIPVINEIKRLFLQTQARSAPGGSQEHRHDEIKLPNPDRIEIIAVTPFPVAKALEEERTRLRKDAAGEPCEPGDDTDTPAPSEENRDDLFEHVEAALDLQRIQVAKDERTLLDIYNRALEPSPKAISWIESPANMDNTFVRADVRAVEPDRPLRVASALLKAKDASERRRVINETVATGCRLMMQRLFEHELAQRPERTIACREFIVDTGHEALPGSSVKAGPGLPEICHACSWRDPKVAESPAQRAMLSCGSQSSKSEDAQFPVVRAATPKDQEARESHLPPVSSRPIVGAVFAGGVFRGVFQVGVLNALNEVSLRPRQITGASIGTIMGGMSAALLGKLPVRWGRDAEGRDILIEVPDASSEDRLRLIRRVAATFITVDRLVLTDRFADFVRRLTLRFAKARFSIRDMDITFRRFDRRSLEGITRASRRVLLGLEQLFFLDPKEVVDISLAARARNHGLLTTLLRARGDEFLERSGIGAEILGAEPLEFLIKNHVLRALGRDSYDASRFDVFKGDSPEESIDFLATVTNVTRRRLDFLYSGSHADRVPDLAQGLLASSAFPGLFRPRWTWEVRPVTGSAELYIDGGITDNLPLVAASRSIHFAALRNAIDPAPYMVEEPSSERTTPGWSLSTAVPHLLVTASLEVTPRDYVRRKRERSLLAKSRGSRWRRVSSSPKETVILDRWKKDEEQFGETINDWTLLRRRAGRMRHNKKLDRFRDAQKDLQRIRNATKVPPNEGLSDIHLVSIKPQWLCGTFAFHPMLGFKKIEQARSIAHGCASTFGQLHLERLDLGKRTDYWWKPFSITSGTVIRSEDPDAPPILTPRIEKTEPGECWFREGSKCPFSWESLKSAGLSLPVVRDLVSIYSECGKVETHSRRD